MHTLRSEAVFGIWKPFKYDKQFFLFNVKSTFRSQDSKFSFWLFGHVEKRLDCKVKVNFEIYEDRTWETANCNTNTAQYLKK